jgi:methionyl aminopeptidase
MTNDSGTKVSSPTKIAINELKISNDNNLKDDADEGEDEDEEQEAVAIDGDKKKKKKKKSKKKKNTTATTNLSCAQTGSKLPISRLVTGFTDYYVRYGQTEPPTFKVADLFPNNDFPVGEIQTHGKTKFPPALGIESRIFRITEEEKRLNLIYWQYL